VTIYVQDVHYVYPGTVEALRGVNLTVDSGEMLLLMGHNGAGKSTLLKHLNGILKPTRGDVFVGQTNTRDHNVAQLAHYVALSFQNPDDQIFSRTVIEEVAFGPNNLKKENSDELAQEALYLLGLQDIASSHPYDLHPSKRKLLAVASTIAMDTPILAFDEPSAGLDMRQRRTMKKALLSLKEKKRTVIIVSHDIDHFLQLCDSIAMMAGGEIVFHGTKEELGSRPDLRQLMRTSGLSTPIAWRLSRAAGLQKPATSAEEFAAQLLPSRASEGTELRSGLPPGI